VHAGVPDKPLGEVDAEKEGPALIWMRKNFLESRYRWEKLVVHGHTAVPEVEIASNRINLDTGCVFDGNLSAIELPSCRVFSTPRRGAGPRMLLKEAGSRRGAVRFRGSVPVQIELKGTTYDFETVDYSELGMCMRPVDARAERALSEGVEVEGVIGPPNLFTIRFRGSVVRSTSVGDRECFGVAFELDHG
jgi:hypothetical protein